MHLLLVATLSAVRPGYAIKAHYAVPPTVQPGSPLPEVLLACDEDLFPTLSRARKYLRRGAIIVNGAEARCISTASPGDMIELQERTAPGFMPRGKPPFPVEIVYDCNSFAIVFKPAGVVTHPPPGGATGSQSMRTAIQYALTAPPIGMPGALYRPHLCHRLDKPTSGLLVCAKTKPALLALNRAFAERRVAKRYHAIVGGAVVGEHGRIELALDGKSAVTTWRVLRRARSLRVGGGHLTSLELCPLTGRTHQLRRHCAEALGCPILGDKEHGGEDVGSGLYLAALGLSFVHPDDGAPVTVEAPEPRKFGELLRREHEREMDSKYDITTQSLPAFYSMTVMGGVASGRIGGQLRLREGTPDKIVLEELFDAGKIGDADIKYSFPYDQTNWKEDPESGEKGGVPLRTFYNSITNQCETAITCGPGTYSNSITQQCEIVEIACGPSNGRRMATAVPLEIAGSADFAQILADHVLDL
ncbi:ribosomal large subunit pseudouridine synthase d, partial [Chrysochromulina tobinii]